MCCDGPQQDLGRSLVERVLGNDPSLGSTNPFFFSSPCHFIACTLTAGCCCCVCCSTSSSFVVMMMMMLCLTPSKRDIDFNPANQDNTLETLTSCSDDKRLRLSTNMSLDSTMLANSSSLKLHDTPRKPDQHNETHNPHPTPHITQSHPPVVSRNKDALPRIGTVVGAALRLHHTLS
jgi:hypothetical protein